MARRARHATLNVFLNSRLVGRVRQEASGAIDFIYDPEWLPWAPAIPVSLSLPLRVERYIGARRSSCGAYLDGCHIYAIDAPGEASLWNRGHKAQHRAV